MFLNWGVFGNPFTFIEIVLLKIGVKKCYSIVDL